MSRARSFLFFRLASLRTLRALFLCYTLWLHSLNHNLFFCRSFFSLWSRASLFYSLLFDRFLRLAWTDCTLYTFSHFHSCLGQSWDYAILRLLPFLSIRLVTWSWIRIFELWLLLLFCTKLFLFFRQLSCSIFEWKAADILLFLFLLNCVSLKFSLLIVDSHILVRRVKNFLSQLYLFLVELFTFWNCLAGFKQIWYVLI